MAPPPFLKAADRACPRFAGPRFAGPRRAVALWACLAVGLLAACGGGGKGPEPAFKGFVDPRPFHAEDSATISALAATIINSPKPSELAGLALRVEGLLRLNEEGMDSLEDSIDLEIKLKRIVALSCSMALLVDDDYAALKYLAAAETKYLGLDPGTFADRGGLDQVSLIQAVRGRILSGR